MRKLLVVSLTLAVTAMLAHMQAQGGQTGGGVRYINPGSPTGAGKRRGSR